MKNRTLFSLIFILLITVLIFSYKLANNDKTTIKQDHLLDNHRTTEKITETNSPENNPATEKSIKESKQLTQYKEENITDSTQIVENESEVVEKESNLKTNTKKRSSPKAVSSQKESIQAIDEDTLNHEEITPSKESIFQQEVLQSQNHTQLDKDIKLQIEDLKLKQSTNQSEKEGVQTEQNTTIQKKIIEAKPEETKPKEIKMEEEIVKSRNTTVLPNNIRQPGIESNQTQEAITEDNEIIKTDTYRIDQNKGNRNQLAEQKDKQAILIALFGTDDSDNSKSDLIMLVKYSFQKKKAILVSIPMNCMVKIPGKGVSKINSTFSYGGPELATVTLEEIFNLKINYYAKINYQGFKEVVDSLGGVQINPTDKELVNNWDYTTNEKGDIILNGTTALKYVRLRQTGNSNLSRIKRQQDVFISLARKMTRFENAFKIDTLYKIASKNIQSDINWKEFIELIWVSRNLEKITIDYYTLKTSPQNIKGSNCQIIDPLSLKKLSQKLVE